jgi:hypothetical protein
MSITKDEFDAWAKNRIVEYRGCRVPGRSRGTFSQLIFGVFVGGGFKVTRGYETLYEGDSFAAAQDAYNSAAVSAIKVI